jgi:histidinol-phosphate aminotransferase
MVTRRSFMRQLGALSAAGAVVGEIAFAREARAEVAQPSQIVWLDSNENPAGPPAAAIEAIKRGAADVGRYHFDEFDAFSQAIATSEKVQPSQVLFGVGSSDVIIAAICAFASTTRPMITASPTYDIIVQMARRLGRPVTEIPLTPQWGFPVKEIAAAAEKAGGGLIYLCNPNNPTASLTPTQDIHWLATNLPRNTVLFVDEAYLEFAEPGTVESAIRYVREDRNVVVSRTFSKIYGMAGARAGFGCARPDLVAAMNEFMDNVIPILGLRAAAAALGERATVIPERRKNNARIRGELCQWLRSNGVGYIESQANFVMIDVKRDVRAFGSEMLAKGVAVGRPFPPLDNMLRVTIGTDNDMKHFREAFKQVYRA